MSELTNDAELRIRARLAWNGWPDTAESRRIIAEHEARDKVSADAWNRVLESVRRSGGEPEPVALTDAQWLKKRTSETGVVLKNNERTRFLEIVRFAERHITAPPADAGMREACMRILPYLRWTISDESPGHHPTMPSAVAEFEAALTAPGATTKSDDGGFQEARADEVVIGESTLMVICYTNYSGETALRRITPRSVRFGSNAWHPEPQWFLVAFDHDRGAEREFALKDIGTRTSDQPVARVARVDAGLAHLLSLSMARNSRRTAALVALRRVLQTCRDFLRGNALEHAAVDADGKKGLGAVVDEVLALSLDELGSIWRPIEKEPPPHDRPVGLLSVQHQDGGGQIVTFDVCHWHDGIFELGLGFNSNVGHACATHWCEVFELGLPVLAVRND